MKSYIIKGIVITFLFLIPIIGVSIAYGKYQLYELEKVEHEVDEMYTISVNLRNK